MRNIEVVRRKQRLDHLFQLVSGLPIEPEIIAHWARYLCVLVSGFIETSMREMFGQYAKNKAIPNISNYVIIMLRGLRNPNMNDIIELTGRFNEDWRKSLEYLTEGELKEAVDSIVANRNQIAHGKDVGITYHRIKRYYECTIEVVEYVEDILTDPPTNSRSR